MMANFELLVFLGGETLSFLIPAHGQVSIGRAPENDVRIDDTSISRKHALLHLDDEPWVEDLGSANGTSVRKPGAVERIETDDVRPGQGSSFAVSVGDVLLFGSVRVCFRHAKTNLTGGDPRAKPISADPVIADPTMMTLYAEARRAAQSRLPILLLGETGVGKEVLARHIHEMSRQPRGPFVAVHMAAMSESLLEAELFGHEKGAFTGAVDARAGLIESADGGTLLLDEMGEIQLSMQVKLLRVLEDRCVTRIGSRKPRQIDVRFVAATHRDLEEEVRRGAFRQDLFYRINAVTLSVPPLRARRKEIRSLANTFLATACQRLDRTSIPTLSDEVVAALERHSWPGNVRELRNVMDRVAAFCDENVVKKELLPPSVLATAPITRDEPPRAESRQVPVSADGFRDVVEDLDRRRILDALTACAGNQTRAAEMLGMSRRTLVARLDTYAIARPRKGS